MKSLWDLYRCEGTDKEYSEKHGCSYSHVSFYWNNETTCEYPFLIELRSNYLTVQRPADLRNAVPSDDVPPTHRYRSKEWACEQLAAFYGKFACLKRRKKYAF